MCKQGLWTEATYKKDTYNCYTFVLTFLQTLGYGELSAAAKNRYVSNEIDSRRAKKNRAIKRNCLLPFFSHASFRTLFCERFICPRTVVAGKYISLYRKIRDNGRYVHLSSTGKNGNRGK